MRGKAWDVRCAFNLGFGVGVGIGLEEKWWNTERNERKQKKIECVELETRKSMHCTNRVLFQPHMELRPIPIPIPISHIPPQQTTL